MLVSFLLFDLAMRGKKANIFSSSPIHIINQWFDERVIIIPVSMADIRRADVGIHIKTRNELNVSNEG